MTDGTSPHDAATADLKAPPGTLERRVQILESIVARMVAEHGGLEALNITTDEVDGPWPKPPPPPPPPPGGGTSDEAGG